MAEQVVDAPSTVGDGDDGDESQQPLADMTVTVEGQDDGGAESTAVTATDGGDKTDGDTHIKQAIDALEALRAAV
ncbi:hypothetical protein BRC64_03525 [Halobacteriales archaeon QH_10_67_22]|nr:MAG: hypothetical protein BRC64_03525 [Halobacteriales archaeon QH_10_67_22]